VIRDSEEISMSSCRFNNKLINSQLNNYLPKCPPDIDTHCVQPEKCRQEEEMHKNC
jgi:hypothetical protein